LSFHHLLIFITDFWFSFGILMKFKTSASSGTQEF